jgi:hypothetical protein
MMIKSIRSELDGTCNICDGDKKSIPDLAGKSEGKKLYRRQRYGMK